MTNPNDDAWAFYREVAVAGSLWTLRDGGDFPAQRSPSGEKTQAFWSSRKRAEQVIRATPALRHLSPYQISWSDFADNWAPGLEANGILAVINWQAGTSEAYHMPPSELVGAVNALAGHA